MPYFQTRVGIQPNSPGPPARYRDHSTPTLGMATPSKKWEVHNLKNPPCCCTLVVSWPPLPPPLRRSDIRKQLRRKTAREIPRPKVLVRRRHDQHPHGQPRLIASEWRLTTNQLSGQQLRALDARRVVIRNNGDDPSTRTASPSYPPCTRPKSRTEWRSGVLAACEK